MFKILNRQKETKQCATRLYESILQQARQPAFYECYGVPDTVTGRFELVVLHGFLVWQRLQDEGKKGQELAQALFDVMFRDLSYALRNIGVGDLAVPHHMKRMMRGYKGRVLAYQHATNSNDENNELLKTALRKNLFASVNEPAEENISFFIRYISANIPFLADQETDKCLAGEISWSDEELKENDQIVKTQATKS